MEGIQSLRDIILKNDYALKLDLKDTYLAVPVHKQDQKYLAFKWENQVYKFTCLPFWAFQRPQDLHKDNETGGSIPKSKGDQDGDLPGRHAPPLSDKGRATTVEEPNPRSPRESGVPGELPQVIPLPIPGDRISRIFAEHNYAAAAATQRETVVDSERGSEPPTTEQSISKTTSTSNWDIHIHQEVRFAKGYQEPSMTRNSDVTGGFGISLETMDWAEVLVARVCLEFYRGRQVPRPALLAESKWVQC